MQVFAKTGAYNMNIKSFIDKWLDDLIDAQTMYNKNGAVPDTAPLGGDNRSDGERRAERSGSCGIGSLPCGRTKL